MLERVFASLTLGKEQRLYYVTSVSGDISAHLPYSPQMGEVPIGTCGGWWAVGAPMW